MNTRSTHPHTPAPAPHFATCTALPPLCIGEPPAPEPEDRRPVQLYALARAESVGWTRNEDTHAALWDLADAGLVRHLGTSIRRGPKDGRGHYTRVFAGSQWEITEPGLVRLRELQDAGIEAPDPDQEIPTWQPAEIAQSTREEAGVYRVELANGAKAVVCRAGTKAAQWRQGWGWADRSGAVTGLPTKADAMRSFRTYRG